MFRINFIYLVSFMAVTSFVAAEEPTNIPRLGVLADFSGNASYVGSLFETITK